MRNAFAMALFVSSMVVVSGSAQTPCQWDGSTGTSLTETCGNVGVGTTTASQKLTVAGNAQLSTGGSLYGDTTDQAVTLNSGSGTLLRYNSSNSILVGGNAIVFSTNPGESMRVWNGNVGIGLTLPGQKLVVAGNAQLSTGGSLYGDTTDQSVLLNSGIGAVLRYNSSNAIAVGGNQISFSTNPGESMRIWNGNVGIGVAPSQPASKLQVVGDLRVGSNGSLTDVKMFTDTAGQLVTGGTTYDQVNTLTPTTVPASGTTKHTAVHLKSATASGQGTNVIDLVVDGSISAQTVVGAVYQDVAEWVTAGTPLDAATVVVLDRKHNNRVVRSETAYDTTVAGVVSAQPGVILGVSGPDKEKIATTGRVKVKVDASHAPIGIGDLLVTSDVPGMAMKSEPIEIAGRKFHQPGTVIGKALEPLPSGTGEILVLLSLQ